MFQLFSHSSWPVFPNIRNNPKTLRKCRMWFLAILSGFEYYRRSQTAIQQGKKEYNRWLGFDTNYWHSLSVCSMLNAVDS